MSDVTMAAIINGLVLIALAIIDQRSKKRSQITHQKIEEVKKQTDGMKDELVNAVAAVAFTQGQLLEKEKKTDQK